MLSVSTGMEVRGGGHGGGPEDGPTKRTDAVSSRLRARAAAHDQEIRKADVQRNIEINYPPIIEHPGGEDFFGHNDRIQLRDSEQVIKFIKFNFIKIKKMTLFCVNYFRHSMQTCNNKLLDFLS